jgi:REP element-mobilizing transposase RayT
MVTISRDTPCLYITAVCKDRLPVFRTDVLKKVVCQAFSDARSSGEFSIFAYVIMPDHIHIITDGRIKPSQVLRFIKGVSAHHVIKYLKEGGYQSSLDKLAQAERDKQHRHSLWEADSNVLHLTSESMFMQKVNYIHLNPVRAEIVERAIDYRWSSVRYWARCPFEDELLTVDVDKIVWRTPR